MGDTLTAARRLGAVAALASLFAARADAQAAGDPRTVRPERPTVATHAYTVATGYLEIETGVQLDRIAPETNLTTTPTVFKFGVAPRVQVSAFTAFVHHEDGSGLGDTGLGAKVRLIDGSSLLGDFSIFPSLQFPTGSARHGTGSGTTDAGLLLISSRTIGGVAIDLNAGVTRRSGDGSFVPKTATLWTASFGGGFGNQPAGWVLELFGYPGTGGLAGAPPTVSLLAGPTLQLRNFLAIDAGLIVPVHGPQPHSLYAGGVYNVGRIW